MPLLLEATDIDTDAEAIDLELSAAEKEFATDLTMRPEGSSGVDLTDGGKVGGATLHPMSGGKRIAKGRAAARRAWMWNGTESVIPLSWNPDGTVHDGGRKYLRKKHCLCCADSGFFAHCRKCRDNGCTRCNGGGDAAKIIPCFYLREEDIPFPQNNYGDIDCFLPLCSRREQWGFKSQEAMRMHAMSRHTREYEAHEAVQRAGESSEIAELRSLVNTLLAKELTGDPGKSERTQEQIEADKIRMEKVRAARNS